MNKYKVLMQADIQQHELRHKDPFNNLYREERKEENLVKSKISQE